MNFFQAMPVVYPNQNLHHEQLSYEMVKELRRSVKENGLHSSFTMNLLHAIAEGHTMLPVDWKSLFKTILTGEQYSVWWMEFADFAQTHALNNDNQQPPIYITASQLSGTDVYTTIWA